jgi:hypothetical protein
MGGAISERDLFVFDSLGSKVAGWQRDFAPHTAKLAALSKSYSENTLSNRPRDTEAHQKPKNQLASRFSICSFSSCFNSRLSVAISSKRISPCDPHRFFEFWKTNHFFRLGSQSNAYATKTQLSHRMWLARQELVGKWLRHV